MRLAAAGASSASGSQSQTSKSENDRLKLGKDDFLKLLVTELRNQNALSPVNDKEMLAQMAQFSTLEQMQNLSLTVEGLARMQHASQAAAFIGRTVTATTGDGGAAVTGVVSEVKFVGDAAYLVVGGKEVLVSQVTRVS